MESSIWRALMRPLGFKQCKTTEANQRKKIQQLHLCHGIANICKHVVATMQWYAVIVTLHPWNCLWCYLVLNIQSLNLTVLNLEAIRGYAHCLPFRNSEFHQKKRIQQHVFSGAVLINLLGRLPRSLLLLFAWLALLGFLLLLLLWRFFVVNFAAVHHGTRSNWNKWVVGAAKNRQNLEPKHGIRGSMQHQLAVAKALGGRAFCLEKQKHSYPQSPATLRPWCRPGPVCMTSRPTPRALRKCWDGTMRCYIYVATLTQWSLPLSITFPSNHSCPSILILLSKGDRFHFLGFTICPPNWQVTLGMSEVSSIFSIFQPANRSIIGRQRSHRIARVGSMLNTIELFPTKLNLIRSSKQLSLSQFLIDASYWCKPRHSPSFAILSRIFSRQRSCPIWLLQEVNSSIPGEGVCKMMATRGLELHFPGASTSTLHFFDVFGHLALNVT